MGLYIPEDDILHSHRRENLKPYTERLDKCTLVFPGLGSFPTGEVALSVQ
jgi:hypothetical protein